MEEIYKNLDLENIEGEIWLPIEGYDGLYQVSSYGRVKSLRGRYGNPREKILRQGKLKNGYLQVALCKEGKLKHYLVHRLVATAFIQNPNGYRCVNHKDECKTNNCADNLEWCTQKYNLNYKNAQARRVASTDYKAISAKTDYKAIASKIDYKARTAKMDYKEISRKRVAHTDWKAMGRKVAERCSKQVYQYSKDGTLVAIYPSVAECSRNGFDNASVSKCCRNCYMREGNNVYKNYIWSYNEL